MHQLFTTIMLLNLWIAVPFASAGIFDSFFLGLHSASPYTAMNGQPLHQQPSSQSTLDQTGMSNATGYWHTNSSSVFVPTAEAGQLRVDLCEGNIVVPLSFDVKKELVIKSTNFPFKRSTPLICSWNVKATTNCRRGLVTMTINERSRLADVDGCLNGYYTVSPFMEEAKICGRVNTVPVFRWYVEHEQPENVTITLRHIGLNDGYSEGFSFNLSGDCLPNRDETTISKARESYASWLQELSRAQLKGGPTVVLPSAASLETLPNISNDSTPFQNASNGDFVTVTTASQSDVSTTSPSSQIGLPESSSPISHSVVVDIKVQSQSNVSHGSSAVELPRENVTSAIYLPMNSSGILLPAQPITQQPWNDPGKPNDPVDFKVAEDQGETPWLILKPPGQSLSKVHSTPRLRPSVTKPEAIVIPTDVLPSNIHTAEKVPNADPDIPWLILKTPDQSNFSAHIYSSAKKPLDQPDPIKEGSNPFYDDDESAEFPETYPDVSLDSSVDHETHDADDADDAAFSVESSQIYNPYVGGYDLDDYGQKVNIGEEENAIPWLILKSPNQNQPSLSNRYMAGTQNTPTKVRPAFYISKAPLTMPQSSIRPISQQSSTEKIPVSYEHVPIEVVPINPVHLLSQNQHEVLPGNPQANNATNWMHSGQIKPGTTLGPLSDPSVSQAPTQASITSSPRNHLPVPLRRNPLLTFDD